MSVRARPGPLCPVKTVPSSVGGAKAALGASKPLPAALGASKPPPAALSGFDGTERAGTRSDGRKQGWNSADGCGEGRALELCENAVVRSNVLVPGAAGPFAG